LTKIFYFISAYKEPENIIRIVNILDMDSFFYIHFDKDKSENFKAWKEQIESGCKTKNLKIVSEFACKWAGFGIVDATLSAMRFFEATSYDYFINLTGECYPLKSNNEISKTLEQNVGFLTYWKLPYEGWYMGGLDRLNYRYYQFPKKAYPYVRIIRIPRLRKKLPGNIQVYGGWSLFCLPKDMVSYVIKFGENNPKFMSFFKRMHISSEAYFQTILLNSPLTERIVNDNKRFIDFIGAHPRTLTVKDFEMLKNGAWLFGRKFNEKVDKNILDLIDKEIGAEKT